MLLRQYELQKGPFGQVPEAKEGRANYVTWNFTALSHELVEAMNELSWKPWAKDEFFNRDAYLKELVDAWHFLMNLILVARLEGQSTESLADEFFERYMVKAQVNEERQKQGYHVIGTKCPDCGRAIEDGTPHEWKDHAYICICGRVNYLEVHHAPTSS